MLRICLIFYSLLCASFRVFSPSLSLFLSRAFFVFLWLIKKLRTVRGVATACGLFEGVCVCVLGMSVCVLVCGWLSMKES